MIVAETLEKLLKSRHSKDVFVTECKNGCSYNGHLRMDAWVMTKSWSNPLCICYEIKVSRSDFLNDTKYRGYLPYCNEFYFVCPPKLIMPNEIPKDCGLLWASTTGTRLYNKKKSPYRDVVIPEDLFRYVLMCRSMIQKNEYSFKPSTGKEFWLEWLKAKEGDLELGDRVGKKLRAVIAEKITAVQMQNDDLQRTITKYQSVKSAIELLGFDSDNHRTFSAWAVEARIEELKEIIPKDLIRSLRFAISNMTEFQETINKHLEKKS